MKPEDIGGGWGFIKYPEDANSILSHLSRYANTDGFTICEFGIAAGRTGNRIVEYLKSIGVKNIKYFGVDNLIIRDYDIDNDLRIHFEFEEMQFIQGDNSALSQVSDVDFGFIDACHCAECVYHDSIAMSKIVKIGGTMGFHDTSLRWQFPHENNTNRWWQHYENGKTVRPLNVVEGISTSRAKWHGEWKLIRQDGDEQPWGGIRIYQKAS